MSKKIIKAMLVLLLLLFCSTFIYTCSAANFSITGTVTKIEGKPNNNLNSKATNIMGAAVGIVKVVAAGIAVVMLLVLAMKYMLAAPSDRAEIKKHAIVYVAGAFIMFGVAGILQAIQTFAGNL